MPTSLYIYLGVFLAVFLSHLIKFKVIIKYDRVLLITFKLLFFKYSFMPIKDEIDLSYIFSFDGLLLELDDVKAVLEFIFSKNNHINRAYKEFIGHLSYRLRYLDILICAENATKTALVYSYTICILSYIFEALKSISKLEIAKDAVIKITPSFLPVKPYARFIISSEISIVSLIYVWAKIGINLLYSLIFSPKNKNLDKHPKRRQVWNKASKVK